MEDAKNNLKLAKENFAMKTSQAYCKIFAPERSEDGDLNRPMQVEKIECTKEDNISAASEKFVGDETLLCSLGCEVLRRLLDKFIWRDSNAVKLNQLWEYFATYYYLPRLSDLQVFLATIRKGVEAKTFAVAEDFQDGKYLELKFGDVSGGKISLEYLLVKAEVAQEQLKTKVITPDTVSPDTLPPDTPPKENGNKNKPTIKSPPLSKHFSMDVKLDNLRYSRELKNYVDEIASLLMNLPNVETSIHVAINISIPEGVPPELKDTVTANCFAFGIDAENFHFES